MTLEECPKEEIYPLIFRIYAKGKTRDISNGIKTHISRFNQSQKELVGDYMTNSSLQELKIGYLHKLNLFFPY